MSNEEEKKDLETGALPEMKRQFENLFSGGNGSSDDNNLRKLNEELELEIPNDQEISNDYVTVMAVSNFLNQPENEELAKQYDYTVEYLELDEQDEGQHNFIAKFKLKQHLFEA